MSVQGSAEWFQERCAHATASCFDAVLATIKTGEAKTRRDYRFRVATERLTGKPVPTFRNSETDRGNFQEGGGRVSYEQRTGNIVQQVGFIRHLDIEWCGCSLDGLVEDDGTIEIKSVLSHVQVATIMAGKYPPEHKAQIQGGLWITERQWCDFVSYSPDLPGKLSLYVYRVERDQTYIETVLEPGVIAFLAEVETTVANLLKMAA